MTDDLAKAKRHIRALLEMSEDLFPGFIPGCGSYLAAEARKDDARREAQAYLDAEGQTVEGGEDWEAKFKAHTEAVQGFLAEMVAVYDPCASGEMPVREVCAFLVKQATDDRQRFYDQEAELTRLKAAQPEHDRTVRLAITDEMALQGAWGPINEFAQSVGLQPFDPRMAPDINEIERVRLILSAALNMATNGTPKEKAGS